MNFLAFLVLFLITIARASSEDTSPFDRTDVDVLIDIFRTLPSEDLLQVATTSKGYKELAYKAAAQNELRFLSFFRGQSKVSQVEKDFVTGFASKVAEKGESIKEDEVRCALEQTRKFEPTTFFHNSFVSNLAKQLEEQYLKTIFSEGTLKNFIRDVYSNIWKEITGEEITERRICEIYNDDWKMDILFTLILVEANGAAVDDVVTFLYQCENRRKRHIPDDPLWLKKVDTMGRQMSDVYTIVLQARQSIKRDGSEDNAPYAVLSNVDTQMIQSLVPLLPGYAKCKIEEAMKQGRHGITLQRAVMFDKRFALRHLTASGINCPENFFTEKIVIPAYKSEPDMVNILRQHPAFDYVKVLSHTTKGCKADEEFLPFLLEDQFATLSVINDAIRRLSPYLDPHDPNYYLPGTAQNKQCTSLTQMLKQAADTKMLDAADAEKGLFGRLLCVLINLCSNS